MSQTDPVPSDVCLFQLQWCFYKISDCKHQKKHRNENIWHHTHVTHKYTLEKYTLSLEPLVWNIYQVEMTNICRGKVLWAPKKPYHITRQYRIYSVHMMPLPSLIMKECFALFLGFTTPFNPGGCPSSECSTFCIKKTKWKAKQIQPKHQAL